MSKQLGIDDVSIIREPIKVTRIYEGSVTEFDEERRNQEHSHNVGVPEEESYVGRV